MNKKEKKTNKGKSKLFVDYLFKNYKCKKNKDNILFTRDDIISFFKKNHIKTPKNIGDLIYNLRYRSDYLSSYDYFLKKDYTWTLISLNTGEYALVAKKQLRLPDLESLEINYIDDITPAHIHNLRTYNDQSLLMKILQNNILQEFLEDEVMTLQMHHKINLKDWGQAEIDGLLASNTQPHLYLTEVKGYTEVIGWPQMIQLKLYSQQQHPETPFTPIFIQSHKDMSFSIISFDFTKSFPIVKKYKRYMFTNMVNSEIQE